MNEYFRLSLADSLANLIAVLSMDTKKQEMTEISNTLNDFLKKSIVNNYLDENQENELRYLINMINFSVYKDDFRIVRIKFNRERILAILG